MDAYNDNLNNRISAIKILRQANPNLGLIDAKNFIDAVAKWMEKNEKNILSYEHMVGISLRINYRVSKGEIILENGAFYTNGKICFQSNDGVVSIPEDIFKDITTIENIGNGEFWVVVHREIRHSDL